MNGTWHYRIMQDENGEWGVHEAYCDGDDLQPHSWTAEPVFAGGCEDVEAVRREIHRLAGDAYRPPISKIWQDDHLDRAADAEALRSEQASDYTEEETE